MKAYINAKQHRISMLYFLRYHILIRLIICLPHRNHKHAQVSHPMNSCSSHEWQITCRCMFVLYFRFENSQLYAVQCGNNALFKVLMTKCNLYSFITIVVRSTVSRTYLFFLKAYKWRCPYWYGGEATANHCQH